jgi:hypothetical protein
LRPAGRFSRRLTAPARNSLRMAWKRASQIPSSPQTSGTDFSPVIVATIAAKRSFASSLAESPESSYIPPVGRAMAPPPKKGILTIKDRASPGIFSGMGRSGGGRKTEKGAAERRQTRSSRRSARPASPPSRHPTIPWPGRVPALPVSVSSDYIQYTFFR